MEGTVFGSNDQWKGLGIFLDSFDNDALVSVFLSTQLLIDTLQRVRLSIVCRGAEA